MTSYRSPLARNRGVPPINIIRAETDREIAAVKSLFLEYLNFVTDYLGQDLSFQGTEKEFTHFPDSYTSLFLARQNHSALGAAGLKQLRPEIIELKRLYVAPSGRGMGIGQQLCQAVIDDARAHGFSQLYLDTDPGLIHANAIYEALGFKDVAQYYDNPLGEQSRYMCLAL